MSRLAEVFRSISVPVTIPDDATNFLDIDRYSDNKAIELQLTESVKLQQSKLDQLIQKHTQATADIEKKFDNDLDELQNRLNTAPDYYGQDIKYQIHNLITSINNTKEKILADLAEAHELTVSKIKEENKKLTQSIYQQSIVDTLMTKLDRPSFDLELGLALGILLHHDNAYCSNDDDAARSSYWLLTRYFERELVKADVFSQKLFEEHLISKAREILLNMLTVKAVPFGSRSDNYIVTPRTTEGGIKLTDTDILHSFTFERVNTHH